MKGGSWKTLKVWKKKAEGSGGAAYGKSDRNRTKRRDLS